MLEKRPSFLRRLPALRYGLAARFTALFLVMALIVAATGLFGISRITLVGSSVQEMVRLRAAQEKMAVLMKVTVQEARVHLLEASMAFKQAEDFDYARDDYEMIRDRFRGYVNLLLKGNAKVGIEAAPAGSKLEQRINGVQAVWNAFEVAAGRLLARKAQLVEAAKADKTGVVAKESLSDLQLNGLIREDLALLTKRLLANPVTQRYSLGRIEAALNYIPRHGLGTVETKRRKQQ